MLAAICRLLRVPSLAHAEVTKINPNHHHLALGAPSIEDDEFELLKSNNNAVPCTPTRPHVVDTTRQANEDDDDDVPCSPFSSTSTNTYYYSGIDLLLQEAGAMDTEQNPGDQYQLGDLLNKGAFGEVHTCEDRSTGERFVVKISEPKTETMVKREVAYLRTFQHPNIVSIVHAYEQPDSLCIILELMDGGDFQDLIMFGGAWRKPLVAYAMQQSLQAIAHLHDYCVVHRDIKLENLLWDSRGNVKLADFGFAVALTEEEPTRNTNYGTPGYRAPEMLERQEYGCKVDLWSLGIVSMELLQGRYQAWDRCDSDMLPATVTYPAFDELQDDAECVQFVMQMLDKNPFARCTAVELLENEFFNQACDSSEFQRFAQARKAQNKALELEEVQQQQQQMEEQQPITPMELLALY